MDIYVRAIWTDMDGTGGAQGIASRTCAASYIYIYIRNYFVYVWTLLCSATWYSTGFVSLSYAIFM